MSQLAAYHFTFEAVGRVSGDGDALYWLKVATHALGQMGFACTDAQAIGIDGGRGAALDFDEPPVPPRLSVPPSADTRRMSSEGAPFR
jgi:hypothetical protein